MMNPLELAVALALPGVGIGLLRFAGEEGGLSNLSIHDIAQMGLGYLIVVVLLVPLMKWLMMYVSKQGESKDTMLKDSLEALRDVTVASRATLEQFRQFEEQERLAHAQIVNTQERILAFLEQLESRIVNQSSRNR